MIVWGTSLLSCSCCTSSACVGETRWSNCKRESNEALPHALANYDSGAAYKVVVRAAVVLT